ncbi:MAG: hypothetical protein RJA99_3986 [Pseudomonadota bacterium]|jgi:CRISPR-associated protein Csb2
MDLHHLLMTVYLHGDGMGTARFHGIHEDEPEWPPAPARVFQALVAGVACGSRVREDLVPALRWLERLPPPTILAPRRTAGQRVSLYVPNNDADALQDPTDVSGIRTAKRVEPTLFDAAHPVRYAWPLPQGEVPLPELVSIAHALYQLGRGSDMAWAEACVVTDDALQDLLRRHAGVVHAPAPKASERPVLRCPIPGSLDSLVSRHATPRLTAEAGGRGRKLLFTNAPKARFAAVSYSPRRRLFVYDIRERGTPRLWAWPLQRAAALIEALRDSAARRLCGAMPAAAHLIERAIIGRDATGRGNIPVEQRIRIVPLPSIGSTHVDRAIRRVLVAIPDEMPFSDEDVDWAFSGLDRRDADTGEVSGWVLAKAESLDMQARFCEPSRYWQSVTAVALPRLRTTANAAGSPKSGRTRSARLRLAEEDAAVAAVRQALRHAAVAAQPVSVRVQREPFIARGKRAEAFCEGTRFTCQQMWHVAIAFDRPVSGPLTLGDGRFLGLGVFAPTANATGSGADPGAWTGERSAGIAALRVTGSAGDSQPSPVPMARAIRRAVMSRVATLPGGTDTRSIDAFFSGHGAARDRPDVRAERHLAYHWDAPRDRFVMLAPYLLQRRAAFPRERSQLAVLDRALEDLTELRAGRCGRYSLQRHPVPAGDPLLRPARVWESVTPYVVTRHRRTGSAESAIANDVTAECLRIGLPTPEIIVLQHESGPGRPLQGRLRLTFPALIDGPLALGRTGLLGGGLFASLPHEP